MSPELLAACERILSATANGLYQGVCLALLAGLVLRVSSRTNAATRYAIWLGVLFIVTALIPAHLLLFISRVPETPSSAAQTAASAPMAAAVGATPGEFAALTANPAVNALDGITVNQSIPPQFEPREAPVASAPVRAFTDAAPSFSGPLGADNQAAIYIPRWLCAGLVCAWAILALVRGAAVVLQLIEIRRCKRASLCPSVQLQEVFSALAKSLETRRPVRLRLSGVHRTAVLLGFFKPVVLLPADMDSEASEDEARHVLRHELAHVNRWDDWANLFQQAIEAALFFHPAVWWISSRLSLEREIACDDHALEASGRPRGYALALANAALRLNSPQNLPAPGVLNNKSQLQRRIRMIMNTKRDSSPRPAKRWVGCFTTAAAALAALAVIAGPRVALAQTPPPAPPPPAAASSIPDDESGPKAKPSVNDSDAVTEAVPPVPAVPAVPPVAAVDAIHVEPAIAATIRLASADSDHLSIEERLDRIERTLEALQAREGMKAPRHPAAARGSERLDTFAGMPESETLERIAKQCAEQAQYAAEVSQHAMEIGQHAAEASQHAVEKAMRDLEKAQTKNPELWQKGDYQGQELRALRSARDSLQRELKTLDEKIRRMEDNGGLKKPSRNDNSDTAPKEDSKAGEGS